jgi:hypothetical protein
MHIENACRVRTVAQCNHFQPVMDIARAICIGAGVASKMDTAERLSIPSSANGGPDWLFARRRWR